LIPDQSAKILLGKMMQNSSKDDTRLTSADLDKFISFLDDNDHDSTRPRVGLEIEFMERNGYDSAMLAHFVGDYVNSESSPFYVPLPAGEYGFNEACRRSPDYIRSLHLQLRDHYRNKWGLTPLTEQQKQDWVGVNPFPVKNFDRAPPMQGGARINTVQLSEEQLDKIARYMQENYPDIVRYQKAVDTLADDQGYIGPNSIGRTGIVEGYIRDSAWAIVDFKPDELWIPTWQVKEKF
jgi:hypothetical protein